MGWLMGLEPTAAEATVLLLLKLQFRQANQTTQNLGFMSVNTTEKMNFLGHFYVYFSKFYLFLRIGKLKAVAAPHRQVRYERPQHALCETSGRLKLFPSIRKVRL